jgi:branched-chain amino acid transport system permease protein
MVRLVSNRRALIVAIGLLVLLLVPLAGDVFYTRLVTRMMIMALAAISLDLILGYGGMVSFGHAAFFGLGSYASGILAFYGVQSGFVAWPAGIVAAALAALVIGALSLRTRGVYFIMITLAFAQMLFYFFISMRIWGRDEGMPMKGGRNTFAGLIDISNHVVFYYFALVVLVVVAYALLKLVNAPFGYALRSAADNERRARAIGFPTYRYKLAAFVVAGGIAGLSGAMMANQSLYVSPTSLGWVNSGDLLVMVLLGGMGTILGPILGAFVYLFLEEMLSSLTQHWWAIIGPLLLALVLFTRGGIYGVLAGTRRG